MGDSWWRMNSSSDDGNVGTYLRHALDGSDGVMCFGDELAGEVVAQLVPVAHLGHMRELFDGIPLGEMNTAMTINQCHGCKPPNLGHLQKLRPSLLAKAGFIRRQRRYRGLPHAVR